MTIRRPFDLGRPAAEAAGQWLVSSSAKRSPASTLVARRFSAGVIGHEYCGA